MFPSTTRIARFAALIGAVLLCAGVESRRLSESEGEDFFSEPGKKDVEIEPSGGRGLRWKPGYNSTDPFGDKDFAEADTKSYHYGNGRTKTKGAADATARDERARDREHVTSGRDSTNYEAPDYPGYYGSDNKPGESGQRYPNSFPDSREKSSQKSQTIPESHGGYQQKSQTIPESHGGYQNNNPGGFDFNSLFG